MKTTLLNSQPCATHPHSAHTQSRLTLKDGRTYPQTPAHLQLSAAHPTCWALRPDCSGLCSCAQTVTNAAAQAADSTAPRQGLH